MAVDEALLVAAAEESVGTLRLYQWHEPTLSLGYFQRYEQREQHAASRASAVVRRQSGGGAILHDRELTYSLALPAAHPLARDAAQLYATLHETLVRLLGGPLAEVEEGPWTLRVHECPPHLSSGNEPFLCFQRRTTGDVLLGRSADAAGSAPVQRSWKVVGSAQRRRRGAVLQHGSILLARSPSAPELPGICDITGIDLPADKLAATLAVEFSSALGVELQDSSLPNAVREAACTIRDDKYGSDGWTRRR